jgi:HlyD family secretion protein
VAIQTAQVAEMEASVGRAQFDLDRTVIVAPVSGRIAPLMMRAGDYASSGHAIAAIVSDQNWRIVVKFAGAASPWVESRSTRLVLHRIGSMEDPSWQDPQHLSRCSALDHCGGNLALRRSEYRLDQVGAPFPGGNRSGGLAEKRKGCS